ncbi:uroporphyrinogen-III synthase [Halalkaliarchaeum desulfuricum]|uniref:Uroporphyrinogen-III synthase n=1 Tax=Halalkaliarchaeum desulfuricum TaxID=2055893 RepID=A0A343TF46_9EURY|nr:uroporphyrinogen-III synthase [Halalkaliarchaeum desulfuricum]
MFRPDDDRIRTAVELLEELGAAPIADPMLAVEPTGAVPRPAEFVVLTSKTGVELAAEAGWSPENAGPDGEAAILVAIGPATAAAAREAGWSPDVVPEEYTSAGLVETLEGRVDGRTVEVARSDHGSPVLLEGLRAARADVHETILYKLVRPPESGRSAELAALGDLDAAAFTSSLTVEHFLEAAEDRDVHEDALSGLDRAIVGAIGDPTRDTAESHGIAVDVVPDEATFEALARAVVEAATRRAESE